MRSFASTLTLGRGGKSDSVSATSAQSAPIAAGPRLSKTRSTSLFAKAPSTPVETSSSVLRFRPALTPGSSCSSDGSASLRTPEDEGVMPFSKLEEKKRWSSWFTWRKPSEKDSVDESVADDHLPPQPDVKLASSATGPSTRSSDSEQDEDSSSDSSLYRQGRTATANVPRSFPPPRATIVQARANLRTLLRNSLAQQPSPPPLVEVPSVLFPRSSGSLSNAQHSLSLESTMHVRRMLWRLDHRTLSNAEVHSIAGLARKPQPKIAPRNRIERKTDDEMISYASMRVGRFSRGLRKWALRPCFEQRFLIWLPDEHGNVLCKAVMGVDRPLAVCDLEFSGGTEALAGLELDDQTFEKCLFPFTPPPPKRNAFKSSPRKVSPPRGGPRKSSFPSSPSPLRLDHSALAEPVVSTVSSLSSSVSNPSSSAPILDTQSSSDPPKVVSKGPVSTNSRAVRFAGEESKDDEALPLGYALHARKRREEKARFLQIERERRAKELAAREVAGLRAAEQLLEKEGQKRREEERRRIEEEKRAREELVKEEIAATRARRETARLGMESYTTIREMHQREKGQTYSRPAYDSSPLSTSGTRRRASDYAAPPSSSMRDPVDASTAGTAEGQNRRQSLAPSAYLASHNSAESIHSATQRRESSGTDVSQSQQQQLPPRPSSIASSASRPVSILRSQSAPNQVPLMAYPMMPVMPVMPVMPAFPPVPPMPVWNMPLLPPNAPFMMQQYSRSPSPGSRPHSRKPSPSPSPTRHQSPVQPQPTPPPSPSRRQSNVHSSPSPSRSPHASASSTRPSHLRYPSGEQNVPRNSEPSRSGSGVPQRPSRSTSFSPLQHATSQPIYRDDRSQKSRRGSSTNLTHADAKRRTTMM